MTDMRPLFVQILESQLPINFYLWGKIRVDGIW